MLVLTNLAKCDLHDMTTPECGTILLNMILALGVHNAAAWILLKLKAAAHVDVFAPSCNVGRRDNTHTFPFSFGMHDYWPPFCLDC